MNKNIGSIIDGLKGNVSTQYGALYESKSVVADTVDAALKDTKKDNIKMDDLDDIPTEEIENTENITADDIKDEGNKDATANTEEPKCVVEDVIGKSSLPIWESVNEEDIKLSDCDSAKLWKKDSKNAFVVYTKNNKLYLSGVENNDPINMEIDAKDLSGVEANLKAHGFKSEEITDEFIEKSIQKTNESYINEKESKAEKALDTVANVSVKGVMPTSLIGAMAAGSLAIDKAAMSLEAGGHPFLADLVSGKHGVSSVARAVITNHPNTNFGQLALAGVGVAAAAVVTAVVVDKVRRTIKDKRVKKENDDTDKGYKCAWGKYYKLDGKEWVQIDKKEYNQLKEKDEKNNSNESYKVIEAAVDEDRWVTIQHTHVLVDDNNKIKNKKLNKEINGSEK